MKEEDRRQVWTGQKWNRKLEITFDVPCSSSLEGAMCCLDTFPLSHEYAFKSKYTRSVDNGPSPVSPELYIIWSKRFSLAWLQYSQKKMQIRSIYLPIAWQCIAFRTAFCTSRAIMKWTLQSLTRPLADRKMHKQFLSPWYFHMNQWNCLQPEGAAHF